VNGFVCIVAWALQTASPPIIDVVYPRIAPGDTIPRIDRVDSNFIFGSVTPPDALLQINGKPVRVWPNGAFLSFQPVDWKSESYRLRAVESGETTRVSVRFTGKKTTPPPEPPKVVFPRLVELGGGAARPDPRGTYYLFPTAGTRAVADGWERGYYRIRLSPDRHIFIESSLVRDIGPAFGGALPVISQIEIDTTRGRIELRARLDRQILTRTTDEFDPYRIAVEFYDVASKIDRIAFRSGTDFVRSATWNQAADGVVTLTLALTGPIWGYHSRWEEGEFVLTMKKPPDLLSGRRLKVAVDAGHGGSQDGAIGPMRLKEKDVNLFAVYALQRKLQEAGFDVLLTRTSDSDVSLTDRTTLALYEDADLLVSLHHNALPDGVNPIEGVYGTSVHYYRPQARAFAEAVQAALISRLSLPDEGIYYHDLALVRPSGCPAILIEAGYMMLPDQELLIGGELWSGLLADGVVAGIKKFLYPSGESSK